MNIGVIGTGLMGSTHVRTIRAGVEGADVVAVSDVVRESAQRVAGGAVIHADPYALVADPRVEAVIVASPAPTHEALVHACLEAGKPVLCEKPLATSAGAARGIVEAEAGRRLVRVGFMRRYDPGYADLKRRVDDGEIGAPLLAHCAHRNPSVPPGFTSEMLITDSVVHEIDTLRWLLGEEIARATVFAPRANGRAPAGLQDPQVVIFETASGRLVDVECFVTAGYGYDIRCEVVGESGALALPADVADGFQRRFATAYERELQSWVNGEPGGADAWDGYAAAAVCEAAVESLRSGRTVDVRLQRALAV
jgi:myo-inositol 2-dehydrogenase / D-chiro-inositol 1-dehydrogenase